MLRIRLAAWVLRRCAIDFEYRVKRIKDGVGDSRKQWADGSTLLRTTKLREALQRLRTVRVGSGETCSVQLVARIAERALHNPPAPRSAPAQPKTEAETTIES